MPLTVTRILDLGLIDGTVTFPARRIPDTVHTLGIYLHRCHSGDLTLWSSQDAFVQAAFEVSFDGRANWVSAGGFGGRGGVKLIDLLTESRYTGFTIRVPYQGQQRWIRGQIVVLNGPIKTAIEVASVD